MQEQKKSTNIDINSPIKTGFKFELGRLMAQAVYGVGILLIIAIGIVVVAVIQVLTK